MYRKFLKITFGIFLIAIILDWVHLFTSMGNLLDTTQPLFTAIVLVLLLSMTLKSIRAARSVDGNVIFGVLSGYVLIGYIGAFVSVALSRAYPGAYSVSGTLSSMDAVYYSFVTMTTLGYGDISPLIAQSRSLAILLSILGPMYVAIIVALMVGKFTASSDLKT